MDIKALLGDRYRDGMSADELISALADVEPEDNSSKLKDALDKSNRESAGRKKTIEKLEGQVAQLLRENSISKNAGRFIKMGYGEDDAIASATALADGDFETLFTKQSEFVGGLEARVKADLMRQVTPPGGGDPDSSGSSTFRKMDLAAKMRYANEHPDDRDVQNWLQGDNNGKE